ncbi:hypothetical protein N0V90_012172 [Kalmusia sp. IMI 367209]|nr:hypothetical protein N0V90_012172 [Kalmusia sp. IMI 367209]
MSKPAHVNVLYPRKDGATFDMKYYLATHMPLVSKSWSSYGLKGYKVTQYAEDAPYTVGCLLEWESIEAFKKAGAGPEAADVFGDIPKFSNEKPTLIAGELVGSG